MCGSFLVLKVKQGICYSQTKFPWESWMLLKKRTLKSYRKKELKLVIQEILYAENCTAEDARVGR